MPGLVHAPGLSHPRCRVLRVESVCIPALGHRISNYCPYPNDDLLSNYFINNISSSDRKQTLATMLYTGLLTLFAAAITTTMVAGAAIPEDALSENPASVLSKRADEYFDCHGSSECLGETGHCDEAIAALDLNKIYTAGAGTRNDGACGPKTRETCKLFLQGPSDCTGSGQDLYNGAMQIRANGCKACGSKHFRGPGNGFCLLTMNYVDDCYDDGCGVRGCS